MFKLNIKLIIKLILLGLMMLIMIYAFLPEPVKVDFANVKKGELIIALEGEGKTRIHDIYIVSTPIDGRITRIESEPGDRVIAGKTIIANMHPANPQFLDKRTEIQAKADVEGAKAALTLANASVKQAKAQLEFDELDFKRTQELFNKKSISQAGLERAELKLKTLQAELETAQSNQQVMVSRLEAAEAKLLQPDVALQNDTQKQNCLICIHSPVDGRVLRILHKSESIVPVGTPLVEIGNLHDLEVNIEMLSTNAVKIKEGDKALIKRWGGDEDIHAIVRLIEPSGFTKISALGVEEQRVNVVLNFTDPIEKWQSLGDAFRVEASIIIKDLKDVLIVPLSSLFREEEHWSVFKVLDGKAVLTKVQIGLKNDRSVQIISGLSENDTVIVHPSNQVDDGVSVEQR